jgi:mono/diheme cytochrome c family protein
MRSAILAFALLFGTTGIVHADAARTWKAKCASCHGEDGKGKTKQGEKMKIGDLTAATASDAKLKEAIEKGVKEEKDGVKKEMEGYAGKLKPEQIDELVVYIKGLKK